MGGGGCGVRVCLVCMVWVGVNFRVGWGVVWVKVYVCRGLCKKLFIFMICGCWFLVYSC